MSIITKRGDKGQTDLMFGKRISKTSHRVATLGSIDEVNAAIGLARASDASGRHTEIFDRIQNLLFGLMGQIGSLPEDKEKYVERGFGVIQDEDVEWLMETATEIEKNSPKLTHWAVPGAEGRMTPAFLDYARTTSRKAERNVLILHESGEEVPENVRIFLNRLSDLFWILARAS